MESFKLLSPQKDQELIENFYRTHAKAAKVDASDFVLALTKEEELRALVRISYEGSVFVLRSMQFHSQFHRQGLGTKLLQALQTHIITQNFSPLYCIPYAHLISFYEQIDFQVIPEKTAPLFLQTRIEGYRQRNPQSSFCVMKRNNGPTSLKRI